MEPYIWLCAVVCAGGQATETCFEALVAVGAAEAGCVVTTHVKSSLSENLASMPDEQLSSILVGDVAGLPVDDPKRREVWQRPCSVCVASWHTIAVTCT